MADKGGLDQILAAAENPAYVRVATARVLIRQDLIERHEQLNDDLTEAAQTDAMENRDPVAPVIAQQIADLEAEMEAFKVAFKFRSIGKRAWSDLLMKHPPTKDQSKADPRLDHNPITFPAAALAASWVDPDDDGYHFGTTADEKYPKRLDGIQRLERALNHSQFDLLWAKCIDANIGGTTNPKSQAAGLILRMSGASAITAATAESLGLSSLAES